MKVEIKNSNEVEKKYPYIGIYKHGKCVVLFNGKNKGVCLIDNSYPTGQYVTDWPEEEFEIFNGEIILKND